MKKKARRLETDCLCFSVFPVAGHGESLYGQRREERRKPFYSPCLLGFPAAALGLVVDHGEDAPPLFPHQKPSSSVLVLPCNYRRFLGFYFVIFELYLFYFEFLLFVFTCEKDV